jgi:hypothetical protein
MTHNFGQKRGLQIVGGSWTRCRLTCYRHGLAERFSSEMTRRLFGVLSIIDRIVEQANHVGYEPAD